MKRGRTTFIKFASFAVVMAVLTAFLFMTFSSTAAVPTRVTRRSSATPHALRPETRYGLPESGWER